MAGRNPVNQHLESVEAALMDRGEGILAAGETTPIPTKRFDTIGIQSTETSRRTYREMLFSATSAAVSLWPIKKIRQKNWDGMLLAGSSRASVAEGLDGLRDRPSSIPFYRHRWHDD
jgi:fructose-bisphosphate aldolase, class I